MTGDDEHLLSVADAVLDGRPIDWASVAARTPAAVRPLIEGLQSIAAISAFHVDASIAAHTAASTAAADAHDDLPLLLDDAPAQWGPLTITGVIGRGRFGTVYRARDSRLDRPVALKLLRRRAEPSDVSESAAVDEGMLMARIRHPNVVTVYGAERIAGRVGLWMELVEGRTLEQEIHDRGPMPWREACRIGIDLCGALTAVHRAGLLHRDLKAQNVLRELDGRVVLADFGAGRALSAGAAGQHVDIAGTPLYLAPEIYSGRPAAAAADVYSLGVLLFHLVTASYPVRGRSIADLREAHSQSRRTMMRDASAVVPASFAAAVDSALAADPTDRFATAEEFGTALERVQDPAAAPKKWRAVAAAAIVGLLAGALGGVSPAGHAPMLRKVRMPSFAMGLGSADGRVFPYVGTNGALHVWEIETGRSRELTDRPSPSETIRASIASPNGDRVASAWSLGESGSELRLINADGTWPRVLITRQTAFEPIPVDWSADGRSILCWLYQKDGSGDLVLVPADGGSIRQVFSVAAAPPRGARLSPDGRFVITTGMVDPNSTIGDLVLIDVAAAVTRVIARDAVINVNPVWNAAGDGALYLKRSGEPEGSFDLWRLPIVDGLPIGEPVVQMRNAGIGVLAATTGGDLYRSLTHYSSDVYTRTIDLTAATEAGPPSRIAMTEIGNHVAPAWSPDGRSMAYFTTRERNIPGAVPERTLTIQELRTGRVRRLPVSLGFLGGYSPRWSPGSDAVVVFGKESVSDHDTIHLRVDVSSGTESTLAVVGGDVVPLGVWSFDGAHYLYLDPARGIVSRRMSDNGERVEVAAEGDSIDGLIVAGDGHAFAWLRSRPLGNRWQMTLEVRLLSGETRQLVQRITPSRLQLHAWTPDGTGIVYGEGQGGNLYRLYRVPETGGEPLDLRLSLPFTPNSIGLSPDGRRIAYSERIVERELWITASPE